MDSEERFLSICAVISLIFLSTVILGISNRFVQVGCLIIAIALLVKWIDQ